MSQDQTDTLDPASATGIATLDDLRRHLQWAIEVEHSTLPPYLTALYSLDPERNADAVQLISGVFVEEMIHLALAANLLNAVGGRPVLDAPTCCRPTHGRCRTPTRPSSCPSCRSARRRSGCSCAWNSRPVPATRPRAITTRRSASSTTRSRGPAAPVRRTGRGPGLRRGPGPSGRRRPVRPHGGAPRSGHRPQLGARRPGGDRRAG